MMAILSNFPTRNWTITLNRVETESEDTLAPSDIIVSGNTVTAISGTTVTRNLTLQTAVASLLPADISFSGYSGLAVVSTSNADIPQFLQQIRELLSVRLTAEDIPDSIINSDVYLLLAETQTYDATGLTSMQYDTSCLLYTSPSPRD